MRFSAAILASAAFFGCYTSASPVEARQQELKPFEVISASSYHPGGRPGSSPWRHIRASVVDPNAYVIDRYGILNIPAGSQGLNCEARWYRDDNALGRTWPCDASNRTDYGHWGMQVLDDNISHFSLRFVRVIEPNYQWYNSKLAAEASFSTGEGGNLAGRTLSSGSSNYYLKPESKPVLAPARNVTAA